MKELQELHQHVQAEAEAIPPAERLQQKQTKDGKFSLTPSALFWRNHQTPHKLVVILCSHFECEVVGEREMRAHVLIKLLGCSVLGRGAEPPHFWVLLIWLEPGISHVTWVHYDATMCLPCFVCSILPVLHFLRFDLCVL